MTNHLIIDFETGGEDKSNCVVFCVSLLFFRWTDFSTETGLTFKKLKSACRFSKFNFKSQIAMGYRVDKSTIDFWQNEVPADLRKELTQPSEYDKNIRDWLLDTEQWFRALPKIDRIWSRGNNMEFPILERLVNDQKRETTDFEFFEKTMKWSKIRDTRTWIESKLGFDYPHYFCPVESQEDWNSAFLTHHPSDDIAADVMRLQAIERAIRKMPLAKIE